MDFKLDGLSKFQKDLLEVAQDKLPKETYQIMRKIGSKARSRITKEARSKVKKKTGNYHKKFKRGKVFKDNQGQIIVRVINSSNHAHLIEHGHRKVTGSGKEVGFTTGKKVMEQGIQNFDGSGEFENMLSDWLDELLDSGKL
ncbi:HK97 gp10 family phage protein [Lysinibacillus sp. JNUCC 51]|uniref:HK97 gp10 family phage protein n=1 Tax=Lysinibacillus sp. JNUCC-51 TaxID=2792479 RepID=UPI001938A563|nr:HK97 gp10 family phage protein [Lysinibacillus sp. JNUCC-51]